MIEKHILALPVWGKQVAPRFGCADTFSICTISPEFVGETMRIKMNDEMSWRDRLSTLRQHDVAVVICGGFNRHFFPLATSLGIHVICGVMGNVDEVVAAYGNDVLFSPSNRPFKQHRQKRCRCGKSQSKETTEEGNKT